MLQFSHWPAFRTSQSFLEIDRLELTVRPAECMLRTQLLITRSNVLINTTILCKTTAESSASRPRMGWELPRMSQTLLSTESRACM